MSGRLNVPALHGELKKMDMPPRLAHQKRRIVKKRIGRFNREQLRAEKWHAGRADWAFIAALEAAQMERMDASRAEFCEQFASLKEQLLALYVGVPREEPPR